MSIALTSNVCGCPAARLVSVIVPGLDVAQLENELPSRLHSKPAILYVPWVAFTWNVMDIEGVEPSFCTGLPLLSTADVVVVSVGGCIGVVVAITETSKEDS